MSDNLPSWRRSEFSPRYKGQQQIVWMLSDTRQRSCQTISNSDICACPLTLQVKNYELTAQWDPGTNHVFSNLIYLVDKRGRLSVHNDEMTKGWYLGNKFQIPEATCGLVYIGLSGCREEALLSCWPMVQYWLCANLSYKALEVW